MTMTEAEYHQAVATDHPDPTVRAEAARRLAALQRLMFARASGSAWLFGPDPGKPVTMPPEVHGPLGWLQLAVASPFEEIDSDDPLGIGLDRSDSDTAKEAAAKRARKTALDGMERRCPSLHQALLGRLVVSREGLLRYEPRPDDPAIFTGIGRDDASRQLQCVDRSALTD